MRPILRGAAHRDTSASGAIGTSAPVLAVVDLGAHDALRALAGRPRTSRLVEVEVQAARRACGPVEGACGGFAALVEVAIYSTLVPLVVAALAGLAVLATRRSFGTADAGDLLAVEVATTGQVASMPRVPAASVKLAAHVRAGVRRS